MNWFIRYAQAEEQVEGDVVVNSPDQSVESPSQQVFDGSMVNEIVKRYLMDPLSVLINEDLNSFLENMQQDSMRKLISALAANGRLDNFIAVIQNYNADVVASGTEDARIRLLEWLENFKAVGGDRVPFDVLEVEINKVI